MNYVCVLCVYCVRVYCVCVCVVCVLCVRVLCVCVRVLCVCVCVYVLCVCVLCVNIFDHGPAYTCADHKSFVVKQAL